MTTSKAERLTGFRGYVETVEPTDAERASQNSFLDELPGAVFALLTLAYIASSLVGLV